MNTFCEQFIRESVAQITASVNDYSRRNRCEIVSVSLAKGEKFWYAIAVFCR